MQWAKEVFDRRAHTSEKKKMKSSLTAFVCSLGLASASTNGIRLVKDPNPAVRRRAKSSKSPCEKALEKAWEANIAAGYVIAETKDAMREMCEFDSHTVTPNLGCPFIYFPDAGFLDSRAKVVNFFDTIGNGNTVGTAFWKFQMYCECAKGNDDKCVTKIPDIPPINGTGLDYCIFSSIWNGDIELDLLNELLNEEVRSCGCTFVGTEKESVNLCPGLDLGANFIDPLESLTNSNFSDPSDPSKRYFNLFIGE